MSAAASLRADGFAIIPLPETITSDIDALLRKAREFFDSEVVQDDVGSLKHLNDVVRFYTGNAKNLFDEFQQVSPGRQAIHLKRGGYLSERYFQHAESLHSFEEWSQMRRDRGTSATSLAVIAQDLLLELDNAAGGSDTDLAVAISKQGCMDNSRFSIYSTTSGAGVDHELSVPAHVDRGFLTLCYAESDGLEVQHRISKQWQAVSGCRGSLVAMAGHLLSRISKGTYPACRHRVRFRGPRLSLVFTLRPSPSTWLEWPLPRGSPYQHSHSKRWYAGEVMDELKGSVSQADGLEFARTKLVTEVLAQQERWVALMMGLHARLGVQSLLARYGGVPAEVWKLACVDALGVNLVVNVDDGSGSTQQIRAYSALKQVRVIRVLEPHFLAAKLKLGSFMLSVEGKKLHRHDRVLEQCWISDSISRTEIMARPCVPDDAIRLKVKGQDGNIVHFGILPHCRLLKLQEAYCSRQSLQLDQIRFLFDGNRVFGHMSAECLDMDDDDVLDSMLIQMGD